MVVIVYEFKTNNRFYEIRETLDLKQKEVAEKLKINRMSYSYWETGARFIPLEKLNDYCNVFDVSMDYVLCISNNKGHNIKKVKALNKEEIGNRLKELFKENDVTQVQVAGILNTTQSTISAYINGNTLILTAFAYQICQKYNVSLDWLCGRTSQKYNDGKNFV